MISDKDLEKPSLHCFDLAQYNPRARRLHCVVFANYMGQVCISADIKIDIYFYCEWINDKWEIRKSQEEILNFGVENILEMLNTEKRRNE